MKTFVEVSIVASNLDDDGDRLRVHSKQRVNEGFDSWEVYGGVIAHALKLVDCPRPDSLIASIIYTFYGETPEEELGQEQIELVRLMERIKAADREYDEKLAELVKKNGNGK